MGNKGECVHVQSWYCVKTNLFKASTAISKISLTKAVRTFYNHLAVKGESLAYLGLT